ncbi:uncharacterized protein [Pyxicephalus adspersus]|uniref:uncharacterized protein n=1 Tax=Pyxicephalus adspersus TaxID=30357 RepID=UPI003B5939F7
MDSAAPLLILMLAGFSLASNSSCHPSQTDDNDLQSSTVEGHIASSLLLPCFFNISQISQAECNNTSVIWSYTSKTESIVEFQIQSSNVLTWGNWKQHIKCDKNQMKNGNFSILILNVNLDNVGNFSCSLYDGINYIRAKRILQLLIMEKDPTEDYLLPFALIGCLLFIMVAAVVVCVLRISDRRTPTYESSTDMATYTTVGDESVMKENEIYDWIWHN